MFRNVKIVIHPCPDSLPVRNCGLFFLLQSSWISLSNEDLGPFRIHPFEPNFTSCCSRYRRRPGIGTISNTRRYFGYISTKGVLPGHAFGLV